MEKLSYIVPDVDILEVRIEQGFAQSNGGANIDELQTTSVFQIEGWDNGEF